MLRPLTFIRTRNPAARDSWKTGESISTETLLIRAAEGFPSAVCSAGGISYLTTTLSTVTFPRRMVKPRMVVVPGRF